MRLEFNKRKQKERSVLFLYFLYCISLFYTRVSILGYCFRIRISDIPAFDVTGILTVLSLFLKDMFYFISEGKEYWIKVESRNST